MAVPDAMEMPWCATGPISGLDSALESMTFAFGAGCKGLDSTEESVAGDDVVFWAVAVTAVASVKAASAKATAVERQRCAERFTVMVCVHIRLKRAAFGWQRDRRPGWMSSLRDESISMARSEPLDGHAGWAVAPGPGEAILGEL
jgi:hypothetical protein